MKYKNIRQRSSCEFFIGLANITFDGNRSAPDAQLRNVDYLEVIYPETVSDKAVLKRSFMVRTADGNANGPFTEELK